jgi:hypothetical protein
MHSLEELKEIRKILSACDEPVMARAFEDAMGYPNNEKGRGALDIRGADTHVCGAPALGGAPGRSAGPAG